MVITRNFVRLGWYKICYNNTITTDASNKTSTHVNYLLHWIKPHVASCSSSEVNSGLFLSARLLPETKSSRDDLHVCLQR